jgi:hypothetical protein
VFKRRIKDIAGYDIGYDFNIGFLKIKHVKVSKVLETPRYVTIVSIFGGPEVTYQKITR